MPVPEANFFGIVIAIQQKSGGNLSEALGNLSKVLRDRKKMAEKIQAMSMEAKASAGIIGSLPPIVMLLVYLSTPRLHLAAVDPSDRPADAGRLRDLDVHRHLRDEENDQLRLLTVQHDSISRSTKIHDPHFMTMLLAAIAASATAYTLVMPLFAGEGLAKRMKAVASERERIRQRERERMNKTEKVRCARRRSSSSPRWWKTSTSANGWRRRPRATS